MFRQEKHRAPLADCCFLPVRPLLAGSAIGSTRLPPFVLENLARSAEFAYLYIFLFFELDALLSRGDFLVELVEAFLAELLSCAEGRRAATATLHRIRQIYLCELAGVDHARNARKVDAAQFGELLCIHIRIFVERIANGLEIGIFVWLTSWTDGRGSFIEQFFAPQTFT
jgi:hypothetical protein